MSRSITLTVAAVLFLPALLSAEDLYLPRGARELSLSGAAYVSHDSPADVFGVLTGRFGVYAWRNHEVGVDATVFAYSRIQDIYVSGFYRYTFARSEHRLAPYAGVAVGANINHFDYFGGGHSLIVKPQVGIRYFLTGKVTFDLGYDLMFRRETTYSLTGKTSSILTFGFSKIF
jgi:hypothetical protein